jgi:hypothetical protein
MRSRDQTWVDCCLGPGGLDWPVMVGWTDSGKWAVFKTCMWPMRETGGELKAVGDFAYATQQTTAAHLAASLHARQHRRETSKILSFIETTEQGNAIAALMHLPCSQEKAGQGCKHAGTSLPVPTSPQNRVRPLSRKIAGSLSSNLFHDIFI